jgi:protease-4
VAREVIQVENIADYTPHEGLAERLARRIGTAMGQAMAPWARDDTVLR